MSDRYTVHPHPGIVGGVYLRDNDEMSESGPLTPAEARRLGHALLDAIGERDEAEAIVRGLLATDGDYACHGCGEWRDRLCRPGCAFARARAFVTREGREDT